MVPSSQSFLPRSSSRVYHYAVSPFPPRGLVELPGFFFRKSFSKFLYFYIDGPSLPVLPSPQQQGITLCCITFGVPKKFYKEKFQQISTEKLSRVQSTRSTIHHILCIINKLIHPSSNCTFLDAKAPLALTQWVGW